MKTRLGRCALVLLLLSTSACKIPLEGSAYGFVGPGVPPVTGFGRYSYVVLHKATSEGVLLDPADLDGTKHGGSVGNLTFEDILLSHIVAADRVTPSDRSSYNVFEHAVKPGFVAWGKSNDMEADSLADFLQRYYDYDYGKILIANICKNEMQFHQVCRFDKGPYIVSVSHPLPTDISLSTDLGRDVYVYDCSPFTSEAYDQIIGELLVKVKASDQHADGGLASVYNLMLQLPLSIGSVVVKSTLELKKFFFKPF